ncbi:enoyl-CoA hydratase/isomerase family protein [Nonomuraea sp. NPDC050556]|uniref:enoyl-CoA hydratase/isomerase family protein n=1 Tax=Nonomuraea sp. NPDC050556 TaxID=3364369 RepID=UPI003793A965
MNVDLQVTRVGAAMVVRFNRPEVLNAFRDRSYHELVQALDTAATDDTVKVVVLTGTGRAFSSGTDLKELQGHLDQPEVFRSHVDALQELTTRLTRHPKVIISAVNGIAVGVGVELAIASDIRIAAEQATFAFKEVHRGVFPSNGVLYLLPRMIGHGRAVDLLLSGDTIDAAEAHRAGLVSRLVPDALAEALVLAERIAAAAPTPVRLIKRAMTQVWELDLQEVLALETDGLLACLDTPDLARRVADFNR